MKLNITLEVDDEGVDDTIEDLEIAAQDHEEIAVKTAGKQFTAVVIDVAEAGGRRG